MRTIWQLNKTKLKEEHVKNSASDLTKFTPTLNLRILVKMCETVLQHSDAQIEGQLLL